MTVVVPGVGVITKKSRCKQLLIPLEIPAARFSCLTSGSFRPKLGLCILLIVLTGCICLIVLPLFASNYGPFSVFSPTESKSNRNYNKMELENQKAVNKVQEGNKNFNIKLYKQISRDHKGNMVISPFSIQSVMSMALSGASGETANQIRSGLSLPEDKHLLPGMNEILQVLNYKDDTNFTLKTANRLYTQEGFDFRSDFLDINKKHYFSLPEAVDFKQKNKARNTINTWVEEQTNQKIKDLMPSDAFNSDTKMVLVNALYFKGPWKEPFETKATFKRDFYLGNGRTIQVDMMHKKAKYKICSIDGFHARALQMPYAGDRISMIFILPDNNDGLSKLEEQLNAVQFDIDGGGMSRIQWFDEERDVKVGVPKFKIESTHDLEDPLKKIGLEHMFDANKADFSGMTGNKDLYVSKVIQKAFIEVNEEGAEASAAAGAAMAAKGFKSDYLFICDHPFLFMIQDNLTGMILFAGKVTNPRM